MPVRPVVVPDLPFGIAVNDAQALCVFAFELFKRGIMIFRVEFKRMDQQMFSFGPIIRKRKVGHILRLFMFRMALFYLRLHHGGLV